MPTIDGDRRVGPRDEGATFAIEPVQSGPRARVLVSGVVLALAGLVALGAFNHLIGQSPSPAAQQTAQEAPVRAPVAADAQPPRSEPSTRFTNGPEIAPYPAEILRLDIRPSGSDLFIHGDVYSLSVVRVSITLEDPVGQGEESTAVDIPGGSTAFRLGAAQRFEAHFFLSDKGRGDGFIVTATALDKRGNELATLSRWVADEITIYPSDQGRLSPMQFDATRQPSTISVHGDVLARQVTLVTVSLRMPDGQVVSSASVTIPAGVGGGRDHRPPLGFDVELAVPTGLATVVLVAQAQAYDAENGLVASTKVRLEAEM